MRVGSLALYLRYLDISFRSQMQYPASFFIQAAAHFLVTGSEFLALVALFGRFGQIRGWTLAEMGLFYGIVAIAFALSRREMWRPARSDSRRHRVTRTT
jgi:ABC-2 type transport system permease protein